MLLAVCQNGGNHSNGSAGAASTTTSQATAPTFATPPAILPTPAKLGTPVATPGNATPVAMGQPVKAGNVTLTVTSTGKPDIAASGGAPTSNMGAHVPPAPPGQTYFTVAFNLTNDSSQPIQLGGLPSMSLTDSAGHTYAADALATSAALSTQSTPAATPIADVSLQPGKTIQTAVGFLIPDNATGLAFVLDAGSYGGGTVKVSLNK